jgi:hypothetical protein
MGSRVRRKGREKRWDWGKDDSWKLLAEMPHVAPALAYSLEKASNSEGRASSLASWNPLVPGNNSIGQAVCFRLKLLKPRTGGRIDGIPVLNNERHFVGNGLGLPLTFLHGSSMMIEALDNCIARRNDPKDSTTT